MTWSARWAVPVSWQRGHARSDTVGWMTWWASSPKKPKPLISKETPQNKWRNKTERWLTNPRVTGQMVIQNGMLLVLPDVQHRGTEERTVQSHLSACRMSGYCGDWTDGQTPAILSQWEPGNLQMCDRMDRALAELLITPAASTKAVSLQMATVSDILS